MTARTGGKSRTGRTATGPLPVLTAEKRPE